MSRLGIKSWLGMAASASCALLLLGACVFWMRSHTKGDDVRYYNTPWNVEVMSYKGVLCIVAGTLVSETYPPPQGWSGSFWPFGEPSHFSADGLLRRGVAGFYFERGRTDRPEFKSNAMLVQAPYWFIALTLLLLTLLLLRANVRALRTAIRQQKGLCPACGYDVRATPEQCPECGTIPAVASAQQGF